MDSPVQTIYFSNQTLGYREHFHDCHEILFLLNGSALVLVNHTKYEAKSGDILLFSRYENHAVKPLSADYERFVLRLQPETSVGSRLFSILTCRPKGFCHQIDVSEKSDLFAAQFDSLRREWKKSDRYRGRMLSLLTDQLLIMLHRELTEGGTSFEEGNEVMWEIQRRLETEFGRSYTLEGLAKEYHLSPSSLSHQFKKTTGKAVMEYLLSCRIAAAKNALANTDLNVGEIVESCGFSDGSNFSRTFKKMTGLSPTAFRQTERNAHLPKEKSLPEKA